MQALNVSNIIDIKIGHFFIFMLVEFRATNHVSNRLSC